LALCREESKGACWRVPFQFSSLLPASSFHSFYHALLSLLVAHRSKNPAKKGQSSGPMTALQWGV